MPLEWFTDSVSDRRQRDHLRHVLTVLIREYTKEGTDSPVTTEQLRDPMGPYDIRQTYTDCAILVVMQLAEVQLDPKGPRRIDEVRWRPTDAAMSAYELFQQGC
jgi:hypothetical protein